MKDAGAQPGLLTDELWNPQIRKHQQKLTNHLIARGVPMRDAEDIANETWLRLWQNRHRLTLRDERSFIALAKAQAWYLALDRFRSKKDREWSFFDDLAQLDGHREPIEQHLEGLGHFVRGEADPEKQYRSAERSRQLKEALGTLPTQWSRVTHLAYFEELEHKDIGARLGISVQRVREILQDAKARIRNNFKGALDDGTD